MFGKIDGLEQRFPPQRTVSENMEDLVIHLILLSETFEKRSIFKALFL
jgi:hypothetical protein